MITDILELGASDDPAVCHTRRDASASAAEDAGVPLAGIPQSSGSASKPYFWP